MNKYLSLAYQSTINFPSNKEYESIDLISSGAENVTLDGYPNLQRIRISKCYRLRKVHLSNMPNLQVIDLLDNKNLEKVIFQECTSITTVEVGYNLRLKQIEGIENVKYLSAPCCPELSLKKLENLIFLDITKNSKINAKEVLENSPNLECLCCSSSLNLSDITKNHSLKILQIQSAKLICDSVDDQNQLKIIIFDKCKDYRNSIINGNENGFGAVWRSIKSFVPSSNNLSDDVKNIISQFYVTDSVRSNQNIENVLKIDEFVPNYQTYQRLLYGPWGVPEVDKLPPIEVKKAVITPNNGINQEKAADAILGSIIASAISDMIGVGVEFINGVIAKPLLLGKMNITWSHPRCNRHNERFIRGTPTDDTSQCILIMRTIVELNNNNNDDDSNESNNQILCNDNESSNSRSNLSSSVSIEKVKIDPKLFAAKLAEWIRYGHSEHRQHGGLGIGSTTYSVVNHSKYLSDPISAARDVWIQSGKKVAPNGSVMRIASSGCFAFWSEKVVVKNAELYAKVTHADPRCVYSSIAAALLIARYIQWNAGLIGENEPNIDQALLDAEKYVPEIEQYKSDINSYLHCESVEDLKLSEEGKIGYCLKAFGSAVWALRYCDSFENGLSIVLREGGDADTNGAVVGALLGAKFGFSKIPKELIDCMFVGQWMFREIKPFMDLMGIEMILSPYI